MITVRYTTVDLIKSLLHTQFLQNNFAAGNNLTQTNQCGIGSVNHESAIVIS